MRFYDIEVQFHVKVVISKNYESYVLLEERTREEKERKREREIKVADYK